MRLLIHDLDQETYCALFPEKPKDLWVISQGEKPIQKCVGCFQCWTKKPGACVICDGYGDLGKLMGNCDTCIIISRVQYGSYSPVVKNLLDRNIGFLLPFFEIRNDEMHHVPRYKKQISLKVVGYGEDITEKEESVFRSLVKANGVNFNVRDELVYLVSSAEEIKGLKEVWA